jgi:phage gp29-like protein
MNIIDKLFGKQNPKRVTSEIIERNNYRVRETISSWQNAVTQAESKDSYMKPDRKALIRIYNDIILDNHLASVIELRKEKVLEYSFYLHRNDVIDEESTKKINSEWFYKVLGYILDIIFYGHSLVQVESVYLNNITQISLVDRENIIPEYGEFMKDVYNNLDVISYIEPKMYSWLFEFYSDRKDLGLLKSIVPLVLWKRSAMSAWAEYTEVFGMPIRIATTTSADTQDRKRLADFVKNIGKSAWAVLDREEKIDFIENKKTDSYNVYDRLIELVNKEISKAVLGVTMLNEDGSSRSQSEVHSEQSEIKTRSDLRNIEFIIKDKLIPKLVGLGVLPEGLEFKFDISEVSSPSEQILIDKELGLMYPLSKEYLKERYSVEFENIS